MRVFVSAGEPSGDLHAAAVVRSLRRRVPGAVIDGIGGERMAQAGVALMEHVDRLGAVGVVEAAGSLPRHLQLRARVRERLREHRYDVVVLVDYPGFNLSLAGIAAARRVPVLYYIAPQLWAWGRRRAGRLRRRVRRLAVILPFEATFFKALGIPATFVGHPLLDAGAAPDRADAREALGLPPDAPVLAVLPGSRRNELARLWPPFRDAAVRLQTRHPGLHVVVGTPDAGSLAGVHRFHAVVGDAATALAAADAALCKSGTVTLEAALAGVPMVIAYRLHRLTFALARRLVRAPHIGLVNLVAGRPVAQELLQHRVTAGALADAAGPLLDRGDPIRRAQCEGLEEVRVALGSPGASDRVSRLAEELCA